jgi:hypothetical protein
MRGCALDFCKVNAEFTLQHGVRHRATNKLERALTSNEELEKNNPK